MGENSAKILFIMNQIIKRVQNRSGFCTLFIFSRAYSDDLR